MPWNAAYWGNLLGLVAYVFGVLALVGGALLSGRLALLWRDQTGARCAPRAAAQVGTGMRV